jgi:hypothetical protein
VRKLEGNNGGKAIGHLANAKGNAWSLHSSLKGNLENFAIACSVLWTKDLKGNDSWVGFKMRREFPVIEIQNMSVHARPISGTTAGNVILLALEER